MKRTCFTFLFTIIISSGVFSKNFRQTLLLDTIPPSDLTVSERNGLLRMREEEKLARDVYLDLYDKFGVVVFKNISFSEQQHMDLMLSLLKRYKIDDPVGSDRKGEFQNADLQKIYNNLVKTGSESVSNALKTGAAIEDIDIYDLQNLLKINDNEDIRVVYENLLKGSRNHMRSFVKQLRRYNEYYNPQYISIVEFRNIMNSTMEKGMY